MQPAYKLTAVIAIGYIFLAAAAMGRVPPFVQIMFIYGIPLAIIIFYIITQARMLKKIPSMFAPEERIKALNGFIRRNTIKLRLPPNRAIRRRALTLLARAYADKGDYGAVYRTYAELVRFLPPNFEKKAVLNRLDAEFYAVTTEAFIHSNRHQAARAKVAELLGKTFSDTAASHSAKYTHAYFLVHTGDLDKAREIIAALKKSPHENKWGAVYLEAKVSKLEKRYTEAFAEFSYIVESSRDFGIIRKAKGELEYWTTHS